MTEVRTIDRLAALARIDIPAAQADALEKEFKNVLAYIGQLDELTLETSATPTVPVLHNVFRKDADPYEAGTWSTRIVALFPKKVGNALSVKKILSHD